MLHTFTKTFFIEIGLALTILLLMDPRGVQKRLSDPFFRELLWALSYLRTWEFVLVERRAHHLFHHAMLVQQLDRDHGLVVVDLELLQNHHRISPAALLNTIKNNVNEAPLLTAVSRRA